MSTSFRLGDTFTMTVTEYRWWEKALRKLTFRRYRMRGVKVLHLYTVTADVTDG